MAAFRKLQRRCLPGLCFQSHPKPRGRFSWVFLGPQLHRKICWPLHPMGQGISPVLSLPPAPSPPGHAIIFCSFTQQQTLVFSTCLVSNCLVFIIYPHPHLERGVLLSAGSSPCFLLSWTPARLLSPRCTETLVPQEDGATPGPAVWVGNHGVTLKSSFPILTLSPFSNLGFALRRTLLHASAAPPKAKPLSSVAETTAVTSSLVLSLPPKPSSAQKPEWPSADENQNL